MSHPREMTSHSSTALAFRFVAGRLCLDFVNTLGRRRNEPIERLCLPDDLARWAVEVGALETTPEVNEVSLRQALALREAIYRTAQTIRSSTTVEEADVTTINGWAARPPLAPQLGSTGRTYSWIAEHPAEAVLATIARDAVDLLSSPLAAKIKECGAPMCSALFVDSSRPGRRRWCSMGPCGNRAKKAAYREREHALRTGQRPNTRASQSGVPEQSKDAPAN